jgi:hypothetical protein
MFLLEAQNPRVEQTHQKESAKERRAKLAHLYSPSSHIRELVSTHCYYRDSPMLTTAIILVLCCSGHALQSKYPTTYNYFGYGSNMMTTSMTDMRGLTPLYTTAAVLPEYRLRFNIPGIPGIEPSAASVEPCQGNSVHGVCYKLTPEDFARVGQTEGVPFGYRWQSVRVFTYIGNGDSAGQEAVNTKQSILAYTLMTTFPRPNDIQPSKSYLNLIQQGANEWNMDQSYREKLDRIEYAKKLIIPNGVAGATLKWAVLQKKFMG